MYILFETWRLGGEALYLYDAMGYADTEEEASKWCDEREDDKYRTYKYCPDKKISYR